MFPARRADADSRQRAEGASHCSPRPDDGQLWGRRRSHGTTDHRTGPTSQPRGRPECGSREPTESVTTNPTTDPKDRMKIQITVGDQRFQATLSDSAAGRDLAAQLPLTIEMIDHGSVEKTGPLPLPLSLDGQPDGADPDVGDVGYYAPGRHSRLLLRRPVLLPRHRGSRSSGRRRSHTARASGWLHHGNRPDPRSLICPVDLRHEAAALERGYWSYGYLCHKHQTLARPVRAVL